MLDLPLEVLAQWVPLGQARLRGQEEPGEVLTLKARLGD